ncbi:MAG: hypothetical protein HY22_09510 [[Candidatus Thermochlorobacteriaceae] bacterium GBChlB]|nr:MAG: hypothetical protein HY22_09510 [[Candidatus Thermochlorobacteriaceae] bacterium GBChlB]
MVDIHSHIIPAVDDGARSLDESLKMLDAAVSIGVTDIAASPHIFDMEFSEAATDKICGQMELLKEAAEKRSFPIRLHQGYEIYLTENTTRFLRQRDFSYCAKAKYVLIEMPERKIPPYFLQTLFELKVDGITPIVAHPERNAEFEKGLAILEQALKIGALFQLDAGSILGGFGDEVMKNARRLVKAKAVHAVASDVHNLSSRAVTTLSAAREAVLKLTRDERFVETVFVQNPRKVVDGQAVEASEYLSLRGKERASLGGLLKRLF